MSTCSILKKDIKRLHLPNTPVNDLTKKKNCKGKYKNPSVLPFSSKLSFVVHSKIRKILFPYPKSLLKSQFTMLSSMAQETIVKVF